MNKLEVNGTEVIFISDTSGAEKPTGVETVAPSTIFENQTMVGVLLRRSEAESIYLLVRSHLLNLSTPGIFYPVDGYAKVQEKNGKIVLEASGRHAHSNHKDVPHPTTSEIGSPTTVAMSWHFNATQVSWA